jgi:hypothetical protein
MTKLSSQIKSDLAQFGFSLYKVKKLNNGTTAYRAVFSNDMFEGVSYENRVGQAKAFITDPRTLNHDFGQTFWFQRQQPAECDSTIIQFTATRAL